MGVHGLWELLAPVGRRVSVETLAGKKLAIDASIWMIQFMKAMRDERGEMVKNAHILGFFRRICKLLFLRSKPVFVFDGGTPALKRRTVIARRRQRENAQAKIRKTAEKLLLNHLKTRKLEELANEIKNKKQKGGSKGKQVISDNAGLKENSSRETGFERTKVVTDTYDQGMLDEMLAASLAAEEDEKFSGDASTSVGGAPYEEEDMMDDNEEMFIPEIQGKIDPAVLASLPPSVQLDLLVQMRERLMAENRQKYQKVKKAPTKFSELQIQSYLKTVAFRREIDEVQKSAAGRGVSGVPVSRIASEANREFIFSSSFTGDKRVLATSGVEKNGDAEHQTHETHLPSSDSLNCDLPTVPFHSVTGTDIDDSARDSDHPVETYLDERGRVRVSRVRGMGIHMTRDLQWNLNMMNELEQQRAENVNSRKDMTSSDASLGVTKDLDNSHLMGASSAEGGDGDNCGLKESSVGHRSAIEVSFLEDETDPKSRDDVDDLFANLVAGSSVLGFSSENGHAQEENVLLRKCQNEARHSDMREERQSSLIEGSHISDDNEVDWEDGVCDIPVNPSPCLNDNKASVSRGSLEEDADMQEAIRRSLEDYAREKSACPSSSKINLNSPGDMISEEKIIGLPLQLPVLAKNGNDSPNMLLEDDLPHRVESMDGPELIHNMGGNVGQNNDGGSWNKLPAPATTPERDTDVNFIVVDEPFENDQASEVELLSQAMAGDGNGCLGTSDTDQDTPLESIKACTTKDVEFQDVSNQMEKKSSSIVPTEVSPADSSHMPTKVVDGLPAVIDAEFRHSQTSASYNHSETMECSASVQEGSFPKADPSDFAREQELYDLIDDEAEHYREMKKIQDNFGSQDVADAEADLGEEMLLLRQEQVELRDEQQKLERNAESVSSEMFAECQELLQMFGLPYIIAPMEAEAQCAYLEIKGLVDGIVTDDSDAFLFGGRSVYKNIFDDRKYVETYLMKDIESELGLTREMLIRMALLLGSDYTEGVSGIGIVNAIEVVHAFPEEDGLQKFREWIESPDPSILDKVDAHSGKSSRKRCSKDGNNHGDGSISMVGGPDDQPWANNIPNLKQNFMEKHRNVSKNWHIPSSFPSESVVSAYASAQVDDSTEPFSWGKPDLFILRKLCWERFGWNNQKADELLQPVLKEYNRHETQLRLEAFYSFNERFAKIRSRRIQKAVKGITGKRSSELMTDIQKENSKLKKRRETASPEEDKAAVGNQREGPEKLASNYPKGKKVKTQLSQSEDGQPEILIRGEGRGIDKKQSRGRGTGRGRGKGRGRRIEGSSIEESKTSCSGSDEDNNEKVEQLQMKTKEPSELRRSARSKNNVSYMEEDAEADDISGLPNHNTENSIYDEVMEQEPFSDNQSAKPCNEGGASPGDYLFSGGGFCVDEADQSNVPVEGFPSPAKASDGLSVDGNFDLDASEINNSLDNKRFSACDGLTNTKGSQQEDILQQCREDSGRISRLQTIKESDQVTEGELNMGLKAMPSLRRKRKKP